MTIGLTQNVDLQRVQIALSDLPDGSVQVQRVINAAATEALWARGVVRGGVALPIVGGIGALDDFEFAADALNHYRTVPVDPPAGLLLDGAAGDYASTPDDPALDITGNIDLQAEISPDDWADGGDQEIVAKYDAAANQRSARMFLNASGDLSITWSADGVAFESLGKPLPSTPDRLAVRINLDVDDGAGQHVVRWWTAPQLGDVWTLFAIETIAGTTSIHAGAAPLTVGARGAGGTVAPFAGVIHEVRVYDGFQEFDGVLVADPDFAAQPHGSTGFTDSAGRVWTVNGTAQIVGIETASITPSLAGKVWLKPIRYPALNRPVRLLDYGDSIDRPSRSNVQPIVGQSPGVGMHDQRLGRRFVVHLITQGPDHLTEAGEWDIILTAATSWFIHTPADSTVPGGYVAIGETSQRPVHRGPDSPVIFRLPCTVEKPPPPQFTGTLLTAETVFRLYGDANALYAAHATGRSLLATIADPEDVVVL